MLGNGCRCAYRVSCELIGSPVLWLGPMALSAVPLTVSTYRGIVSGWRTITVTNDKAKAERMLSLASRIFSAYPNRLR